MLTCWSLASLLNSMHDSFTLMLLVTGQSYIPCHWTAGEGGIQDTCTSACTELLFFFFFLEGVRETVAFYISCLCCCIWEGWGCIQGCAGTFCNLPGNPALGIKNSSVHGSVATLWQAFEHLCKLNLHCDRM